LGVEEYCDAREIVFDSRIINELWAQVDDNEDGVLDLHEFSVFLARYCDAVGVALDDMAMVVFSQLSQGMEKEEQEGEVEEKPESPWAMLASLTGRRHSKRVSWANLKVESEKIERNPQVSIWDSIKVNFNMNHVEKAKEMGDHDEKNTAVDNLWHKLNESMDFRKKRLDNALAFGGKKKVTATDQKQKEPKKRTISRIEASSLDGFFSSVGEVVKQNQRDRETSSSIVPSLGFMTGVGSDDGKATDASSTDFRARGSWTNLAARRDMH
jgi:chemotaxis protein histidine kinase CheA